MSEKLDQDWSPELIAGRFRFDGISTVSYQSIYNWQWSDRQTGGELYRKLRRKLKYFKYKTKSNHILDRRMIEERPAIVETRARFGDWELDTVLPRKDDPCIMITSVERSPDILRDVRRHFNCLGFIQGNEYVVTPPGSDRRILKS